VSASNWVYCPRCVKRGQDRAAAQRAAVDATYGTVPAHEYLAAISAIPLPVLPEYGTFREDYSISGAERGVVTVTYSGQCSQCSLSLDFTRDYVIPDVTA
jgi:hypothetical protein